MGEETKGGTHLHDLPEAILTSIFTNAADSRSRNSMSLVCRRWRHLERSTRTTISLRGNSRHLFLLPTCFPSVTHLDLSLLSPWGSSFHHQDPDHLLIAARCLRQAFPLVISLTVYARTPSTLQALAPQWPGLRHAKLVRWHQRPPAPLPGADFDPLFLSCPSLTSLDLTHFYFWTEDLPAALQSHRPSHLTKLDLLSLSSVEGFKSSELISISSSCPTLRHLLAPCAFDPRYDDSVGDEALSGLAANCKNLSTLHLVDHSAVSAPRADAGDEEGFTSEDSKITHSGLEIFFSGLLVLEDLVLDVCHNVRETGPVIEFLSNRCPRLKSLKLGQFHNVCKAAALHLDGIAVCGGLTSLSIKNSADLNDSSLIAIARGCSRLTKFEIQGCRRVTLTGMRKMASMLRSTLVDVMISCCKHLDAARSLHAMEPVRDRIERLHIDCVWSLDEQEALLSESLKQTTINNDDIEDFEEESSNVEPSRRFRSMDSIFSEAEENDDHSKNKKCRFSDGLLESDNCFTANGSEFWCRNWSRLRRLSLWVSVGQLLTPLIDAGLESCPELEEICIKVEGDCRMCPKPTLRAFGLSSLLNYPKLSKMKLDLGDMIGYVLTAPMGQMDLSLWERFYLNGIEELSLQELDYWPPQDRDMNQRSLSLPAVGLLAECTTLRKLFIHGTTHEHFMGILLNIQNLRDVQLREDYYPAPENDTSTEMRVDSCSRFEDALNRRQIPD